MDWRTALITFGFIFLAELGDKTQLAVVAMSSRTRQPWMVFAGAAAALITSTLVATLAGETVMQSLPVRWIRLFTGITFLVLGLIFIGKAQG